MSILGPLGLALIIGHFLLCTGAALLMAGNSGKISREEEAGVYRSRHPANTN